MRRRSSQCLLPRESADRATTRSIRRPKPCSQSREAVRMRAAPQSPFSIASWCGLLHASRLMRPLLDPSYFHARSFRPKIITSIIRSLLFLRKCHFATKNGQKIGSDLLSFPTKKALAPEGSHVRRDTQKEGRIYEPLEENAGRSREVSFCVWNARLAHSALSPSRCGSVTPARFQRRDWSLLYEKLLYTYISLSY